MKRAERSEDSHESHETMSNENLARVKITPNIFMSMCPALLVQIEQGSCNEQTKTEADDPQKSTIGMQMIRLYDNFGVYVTGIFLMIFSLGIGNCISIFNINMWSSGNRNCPINQVQWISGYSTISSLMCYWYIMRRCFNG